MKTHKPKYVPKELESRFLREDKTFKQAKETLEKTKMEIRKLLVRGLICQTLVVSSAEDGVSGIKWQEVALSLAEKLYPEEKQFNRWRAGLDKKYPKKDRAVSIASPKVEKPSKVVSIEKGRRRAA